MLFAFTAKNNLLLSPFDKIKKPSLLGEGVREADG